MDMEEYFKAFPDIQVNVKSSVLEGSKIVNEIESNGTHEGLMALPDGEELAPTGKSVKMLSSHFLEVNEDGLISEERRYYDIAGIMYQLGVLESKL